MTPLLAGVILAAGAVCNTEASIRQQLADKWGEKPIFSGLGERGGLFTLFASKDSWTWVITTPQGVSCVLNAGGDGEPADPA